MSKGKMIMIGGYARAGKDTTAQYISKNIEEKYLHSSIVSLAYGIKDIVAKVLKIKMEDLEENKNKHQVVRNLLIDVGEAFKKFNKNIWSELLKTEVQGKYPKSSIIIVPDWRFEEEYEFLKEHFDIVKIKVEPLEVKNVQDNNPLIEKPNDYFDYIIRNIGSLEYLEDEIVFYIEDILAKLDKGEK